MYLSSSFRGSVLGGCLALALGLISPAQTLYTTNGGQYAPAGLIPGSQVRPQAALSSSGGFLVWEDNIADKSGLGIRAIALDSNFSAVQAPFRVNHTGFQDQDHPRVVLLAGGGAVFVWQSGRPGFQHVLARFLSTSNTWLTADVAVNTNKNSQYSPVAAALDNGNVAIVWTSINQAGPASMLDVFGQVFSPAGQKVGAQFQVNQFTDFNQRTPAITALKGGNFLVAWVSEEQSRQGSSNNPDPNVSTTNVVSQSSVEILFRVFANDGSASAPEQLVNHGPELCGNPSLAAGSDGGFVIAWSQRNLTDRSYGWDVFARPYLTSARAEGATRPVNTFLTGDQFAPQVSVVGTDYLIVWTSVGQDGSGEGVYGQFLGVDGSPVGGEFRVNTSTLGAQIHPALGSDGATRFLSVWSSFTSLRNGMDLYAQSYASSNFVASVPPITNVFGPPPPEIFDDSTVDPAGPPNLDPPPVVSNPGSNSFAYASASFNGVLYDQTNGVSPSDSGFFSLTMTAKGAGSARFVLAGHSYSLTTQFDPAGRASGKISRGLLHALNVQFQVDSSGTVQGAITDGHWVAGLFGNRGVGAATKSLAAPYVGSYTVNIPGAQISGHPSGDGYGTAKVNALGHLDFAGSLADGTKVSQSVLLSETGLWPVYANMYQGAGELLGWMQFSTNGIAGELIWIKQASAPGRIYPGGFTNHVSAYGSAYHAPLKGQRAIQLTDGNGSVSLSASSLAAAVGGAIVVDAGNHVTSKNNPSLKVSITPATGLFKGSVMSPEAGLLQFQGAIFRDRNVGLGYFIGPAVGGQISVEPAP